MLALCDFAAPTLAFRESSRISLSVVSSARSSDSGTLERNSRRSRGLMKARVRVRDSRLDTRLSSLFNTNPHIEKNHRVVRRARTVPRAVLRGAHAGLALNESLSRSRVQTYSRSVPWLFFERAVSIVHSRSASYTSVSRPTLPTPFQNSPSCLALRAYLLAARGRALRARAVRSRGSPAVPRTCPHARQMVAIRPTFFPFNHRDSERARFLRTLSFLPSRVSREREREKTVQRSPNASRDREKKTQ